MTGDGAREFLVPDLGEGLEEFDAVQSLAARYDNFWASVGVHPDEEDILLGRPFFGAGLFFGHQPACGAVIRGYSQPVLHP